MDELTKKIEDIHYEVSKELSDTIDQNNWAKDTLEKVRVLNNKKDQLRKNLKKIADEL